MAIRDIEVKISELNPLRYVQSNKVDLNYATANFQNTLFSVNGNAFKYIQPFGVDDILRSQIVTYGEEGAESYVSLFAELYDASDNLITDLSLTEKVGDWNNGDLKVYEFEYTLDTAGQYYVKISIDSYPNPGMPGELITTYFYSETFVVDGAYNCLPKLIYSDSRNYPTMDMYFATETMYQMRVEIGLNQLPQTDVTGYEDNVRDFKGLHSSFYYKYEVFSSNVIPIWIASKIKFALALDACYVNFEPMSLIGNDEIELVEDGLNACTFKFKVQPNKQLMSISADDFSVTGETYKDFTNITCNPSSGAGTCSPYFPYCPSDESDPVFTAWLATQPLAPYQPLDISGQDTATPTDTSLFSWWNGSARVKSTLLSIKQYFKGWFATQNPGICATTPVLPTDIDIAYDDHLLIVSKVNGVAISASNPLIFFTDGDGDITKHVKTSPVTFTFANTSAVWYFYFDSNGDAIATTDSWTDFATIAPVYRMKWQASAEPNTIANAISELYECHPNTMTWVDHLHAHLGGTVHVSGYDITDNRLASGAPNADGRNTCISLTSGTVMDDNILFSITSNTSGDMLTQDLGELSAGSLTKLNAGLFKIRYKGATTSIIENASRFPFLFNSVNNKPQYVNTSGVKTDVSNGYLFVYFVYSINDRRGGEAIRITPVYSEYSTIQLARGATWETIQGQDPDARDNEIRPLYRLIFAHNNSYGADVKYSVLREIEDVRKARVTTVSNVGGSINEASVITAVRTNLPATNLASNLDTIDAQIIAQTSGTITTGSTLNLAVNSLHVLTTELTNSYSITITPTKPTAFNYAQIAQLEFSTGSTTPTITFTMPTDVVATWRHTQITSWTASKKYTLQFVWISATRVDIYYLIS